MDGFWTVKFTGVQGFGTGVITLTNGKVFGGDSAMLYTGTYTQKANDLHARVNVRFHTNMPSMQSVMGRSNFELELSGTLQGDTITALGTIPGTQLRLNATLTRQTV
ncbi:MAG: hypothetical protein P4K98_03420 [Bryobacteraceae bacterium]|nr:hypothetical protein [Bryobacteraceae bacterium]